MMRLGHRLMTTSDITEQTHDPSELVDWEYKLQEEHAHTRGRLAPPYANKQLQ